MKIIKDPRVRCYELVYLLPTSLTSDEIKKEAEAVLALIKKAKGKVLQLVDWGKKELAYTIKQRGKRQNEAIYTFLTLELNAEKIQQLRADLRLQAEIMRYLLVTVDCPRAKIDQKPAKLTSVKPSKSKTEVLTVSPSKSKKSARSVKAKK